MLQPHSRRSKTLCRCLATTPRCAPLLATLLGQQGSHMAAVRHARVAVDRQPGFPGYHGLLAMSYWYAGFFSLAYRANRTYQKLDPQGSAQFAISQEIETVQQAALDELAERYGLAGRRAADDTAYHMDLGVGR